MNFLQRLLFCIRFLFTKELDVKSSPIRAERTLEGTYNVLIELKLLDKDFSLGHNYEPEYIKHQFGIKEFM